MVRDQLDQNATGATRSTESRSYRTGSVLACSAPGSASVLASDPGISMEAGTQSTDDASTELGQGMAGKTQEIASFWGWGAGLRVPPFSPTQDLIAIKRSCSSPYE